MANRRLGGGRRIAGLGRLALRKQGRDIRVKLFWPGFHREISADSLLLGREHTVGNDFYHREIPKGTVFTGGIIPAEWVEKGKKQI